MNAKSHLHYLRHSLAALELLTAVLIWASEVPSMAGKPPEDGNTSTPKGDANCTVVPGQSKLRSWMEGDGISGEWGGYREKLEDRGVRISGGYTGEVWGNTTGGIKTGVVYTGLLDFNVELDMEKLVGWKGASFGNTWYAPQGQDLSLNHVGNSFTVSNIATYNSLYLSTLWFQQNFLDDVVSVRAGQLLADEEFVVSEHASLFLNGTFGWPVFLGANLPSGGPAYPVGTLGVRVAFKPADWFSLQTAAFQGDPYIPADNTFGLRWNLDDKRGYLIMNEAAFIWGESKKSRVLPGSLKLGGWVHTGTFSTFTSGEAPAPTEVEDAEGAGELLDAESEEGSSTASRNGNYGFYVVLDQMLFRESDQNLKHGGTTQPERGAAIYRDSHDEEANPSIQGLCLFFRAGFQPQDRNPINFYFDTGLNYTGPIPNRDEDIFGVALAYGHLSRGFQETLAAEGARNPGYEIAIELTYQAKINNWMTFQPDIQFLIRPGGSEDLDNAIVVGGRLSVAF